MNVTLITINNVPVSVGVGKYCFAIEKGKLEYDPAQLAGCKLKQQEGKFWEAYRLCVLAWETQTFDDIEQN